MTINLWRYAIVYLLATVGFAVAAEMLSVYAGVAGGSGAATVVPAMVASIFEGQRWARHHGGSIPAKGALWQGAWRCTLAAAAVNLVTLGLLWMVPAIRAPLQAVPAVLVAIIFVVLLGVTLLVNRFGLGLGVKSELKRRDRA